MLRFKKGFEWLKDFEPGGVEKNDFYYAPNHGCILQCAVDNRKRQDEIFKVAPYDPAYVLQKGDILVRPDGLFLVVDMSAGKSWGNSRTDFDFFRLLAPKKEDKEQFQNDVQFDFNISAEMDPNFVRFENSVNRMMRIGSQVHV